MKGKPTYAGKIDNSGAQTVDALFKAGKAPKGKVIKGDDLRAGKSKVQK